MNKFYACNFLKCTSSLRKSPEGITFLSSLNVQLFDNTTAKKKKKQWAQRMNESFHSFTSNMHSITPLLHGIKIVLNK